MLLRPLSVQKKIANLDADERLLAGSKTAICCFDMEELMIDSINIYGDVCRLDDNFYEIVYSEPGRYNAELADSIKRLFKQWYDVVARGFHLFGNMREDFLARGFPMHSHDELRRLFSECYAVLNPSDIECDHLTNEAISDNRQGTTVCM